MGIIEGARQRMNEENAAGNKQMAIWWSAFIEGAEAMVREIKNEFTKEKKDEEREN